MIFILILFLSYTSYANYDVNSLDWSKAKKNYCARNVVTTLGLKSYGNAYQFMPLIDKITNPEVWDVIVIDRYHPKFQAKGSIWYKYWHIAIIISIDREKAIMTTYDWYYKIDLTEDKISGYVSYNKLIELWAKL